jgi:hypothetical protein
MTLLVHGMHNNLLGVQKLHSCAGHPQRLTELSYQLLSDS